MYDKEHYQQNKEKYLYYKQRYISNKDYIYCDICKKYKSKRNYDVTRHKKLIHSK